MTEDARPDTRGQSTPDATIPLLVEFAPGSRITRSKPYENSLPVFRNGPPGTFVHFEGGGTIPLPTDQIVLRDHAQGAARVGFGGMRFVGVEDGLLTFRRDHDLLPEEFLSPERRGRMTLEPHTVVAVYVLGRLVWPAPG